MTVKELYEKVENGDIDALNLTDIQLAGKKRMEVKPFLAGFRDPMSYTTTQGTSKAEIAKTRA